MMRGKPEIEVMFDVDANGILNVSAEEKKTGKKQNIVITNDGSRLNQTDIDEMIQDAEKYKEEDEKHRQTIEARNAYENYIYEMKSTIEDASLKEKLGDHYSNIRDKLSKAEEVLQVQEVSKEEYQKAQQELEAFINPIMNNIVKEGGGETMPPPTPTPSQENIEEID
jgi:L1 cell adhesion molecule like protein